MCISFERLYLEFEFSGQFTQTNQFLQVNTDIFPQGLNRQLQIIYQLIQSKEAEGNEH